MTESVVKAITKAVKLNTPFVAYSLPGEAGFEFYAAGDKSDKSFLVSQFEDFDQNPIELQLSLSADEYLAVETEKANEAIIAPSLQSTDKEGYISKLDKLIPTISDENSKVVISRLISFDSKRIPVDTAAEYFDLFPNCFRYIYFLPQTGLWFGATPELLLDYDKDHHKISSMSLAGTLSNEDLAANDWDQKNIAEQDIVTNYIVDTFRRFNLNPEVKSAKAVRFGNISHICNIIQAQGDVDANQLLKALSPTPALCGYPKLEALEQILSIESHRRYCYGGWIGISTPKRLLCFVNIRCAFVAPIAETDSFRYNIYAGGGITSRSNPNEEWIETCRKSAALTQLLTKS